MWDNFIHILTVTSIWELLLIFLAKIIEVSIGTMRIILISKGYRKLGTILALIEIILWVFIASGVITGISESPMKGIVYSFGFAAGVFVGSLIEQKLAFGKVQIQTITDFGHGKKIANHLRNLGYGVTTIDAIGKDEKRMVLITFANRKSVVSVIDSIREIHPNAMVVSNDISNVTGGYIMPLRKLFK
ncbi:uncharacterized protein YebE (UPF0316 family) [Acholeplasma morum]|uniref:DUF2179 domain-containing protein n=1 Tax=Paracholeplasma morum TaxID=264637 RepID=UPI001956134A|nr:DUF5698 domain-containing protein [Paracholeplasma morum]MBM7452747.1 uncharacterized protein YebE (UPF0316 family) [Paracholeplasma morum]